MVEAPARDGTDTSGPPAAFSADFGPGTFVPHACFAWMPRLTDTELRLLLIVIRQTLGWRDPSTGARKRSDWLSLRRLTTLTGRGHAALSLALDGLVRKRLVEVRGTDGEALDTPQGRRAAGRLWLAPGPALRSAGDEEVQAGDVVATTGTADGLAALAHEVFEAEAPESGSGRMESRHGRSVDATPGEESRLSSLAHATPSPGSGIQKVDTTKETLYKIRERRAVQKEDTAGPGQPRRPTPAATTPVAAFPPATEVMMQRFARYERESAAREWRWDAAQKEWLKRD